jgi:hypothetical protein
VVRLFIRQLIALLQLLDAVAQCVDASAPFAQRQLEAAERNLFGSEFMAQLDDDHPQLVVFPFGWFEAAPFPGHRFKM